MGFCTVFNLTSNNSDCCTGVNLMTFRWATLLITSAVTRLFNNEARRNSHTMGTCVQTWIHTVHLAMWASVQLGCLSVPWGRGRQPLAELLLVFKNASQGIHIPAAHLSLVTSKGAWGGQGFIRLLSALRADDRGEKSQPKNRMPCHVHKERQSPDDTLVCQISVIKIPPSHRVGRHLELAAGQVGVGGGDGVVAATPVRWCGDVFPHGDGK